MEKSRIKSIKAREILDSRGNPTVEVALKTDKGILRASVPSGASTGRYEAKVVNASKAVENINKIIAPRLMGKNPLDQKKIDRLVIKLEPGANAALAVSMAVCRAGAASLNIPLYQYISEIENCLPRFNGKSRPGKLKIENWRMPQPAFNILNGGAHAENNLDIQEFMVIPQESSFSANLKIGKEIYGNLGKILKKRFNLNKLKIGDEGGFAPMISKTEEALEILLESIKYNKACIGLDCAASQLFNGAKYSLEGKKIGYKRLLSFYKDLVEKFPIISIEDPFDEDDLPAWKELSLKLENLIVIGDDLTVTNKKRLERAVKGNCLKGVIIKPNQVGTITETLECVEAAKRDGLKIMVSHRSGETMDDFIADLAVGIGADFIKSGAPFPKERMVKYNRLLRIEKELFN